MTTELHSMTCPQCHGSGSVPSDTVPPDGLVRVSQDCWDALIAERDGLRARVATAPTADDEAMDIATSCRGLDCWDDVEAGHAYCAEHADQVIDQLFAHIAQLRAERDAWKRAAESQNAQWSAKCTEATEQRARATEWKSYALRASHAVGVCYEADYVHEPGPIEALEEEMKRVHEDRDEWISVKCYGFDADGDCRSCCGEGEHHEGVPCVECDGLGVMPTLRAARFLAAGWRRLAREWRKRAHKVRDSWDEEAKLCGTAIKQRDDARKAFAEMQDIANEKARDLATERARHGNAELVAAVQAANERADAERALREESEKRYGELCDGIIASLGDHWRRAMVGADIVDVVRAVVATSAPPTPAATCGCEACAATIVDAIVRDIRDRVGIGDTWDEMTHDVRAEVIDAWRNIIIAPTEPRHG